MRAYYCISDRDREFLYIPFVLFSYCSKNSVYISHSFDANLLGKLTLAIKEGKITRKRLEDKKWEVSEVCIPDRVIKKFRNICFKNDMEKIHDIADRIFGMVQEYVEKEEEADENYSKNIAGESSYHDSYDGMYDQEDYEQDWWKRGDNWDETWDL